MSSASPTENAGEWLEADGLGGFASGTARGVRTRRYHALLLTATTPPTGRVALVQGVEAWVERGGNRWVLTRQCYAGGTCTGDARVVAFTREPWPVWTLELPDGTRVLHECFVPRGEACCVLRWRLEGGERGAGWVLRVRPLLSGRDAHALQRENPHHGCMAGGAGSAEDGDGMDALLARARRERAGMASGGGSAAWATYPGVPGVRCESNGRYEHAPQWYRSFLYEEERARGFGDVEDLASPGVFSFDIGQRAGVMVLRAGERGEGDPAARTARDVERDAEALRSKEAARRAAGWEEVASDAYLVRRGRGMSIIAGYPWFADWGRDAMIAVRGLCLARGRVREAVEVLCGWGAAMSGGLLPNRFPDHAGDGIEYNSVDAPLWFVVAADEALRRARRGEATPAQRESLVRGILCVVTHFARGTAMGIGMDEGDGLLWSGTPGTNLTWMDARVRGRPITPRVGKPVEVQALWVHALCIAAKHEARWKPVMTTACRSLRGKFWNEREGCLYDVIDVEHTRGRVDASVRPNQVLAVGGLPRCLLSREAARRVVARVERDLVTPLGLRSLSPADPAYRGRYEGGPEERDGVYHQGTAWAWLMGPFVEAWMRARGGEFASRREAAATARRMYLEPLLAHARAQGGHVCEIADGDIPQRAAGCPFQAWSLAELLRVRAVLAEEEAEPASPARRGGRTSAIRSGVRRGGDAAAKAEAEQSSAAGTGGREAS